MTDIISRNVDKKALFNFVASSEHIMKAVSENDGKINVTGVMFSQQAGKDCAYIITKEEAYFTDSTTLISELNKLASLFESEILGKGLDVTVVLSESSKGKTVYKLTID